MNKTQLVDALAARLGDRRTAASAVDGLLETIVDTVKGGEPVALTGFGVFEARARAARTARNPRTGEAVAVPAATVPAFRPGTAFRSAVGGGGSALAPRTTPARGRVNGAPVADAAAKAKATTVAAEAPAKAPAKKAPAKAKAAPAKAAPAAKTPAAKASAPKASTAKAAAAKTPAAKSPAAKAPAATAPAAKSPAAKAPAAKAPAAKAASAKKAPAVKAPAKAAAKAKKPKK